MNSRLKRHIFVRLLMNEHQLGRLNSLRLRKLLRSAKAQAFSQPFNADLSSWRVALIWTLWRLAHESPLICGWGIVSFIPALLMTGFFLVKKVV